VKGIILAAGSGTRLYPASLPISKILLPIYDKPMIYYPLSTLMLAEIRDVLIITNQSDHAAFKRLLGDGSHLGINIQYSIQRVQRGIADAFIIAEEFINRENVVLILGDNVFYDPSFPTLLKNIIKRSDGATILGHKVSDPKRFGVVEFDENRKVISLEEKPENPKSSYAATGLYFYDDRVCEYAKQVVPSSRGELEITDLNKIYMRNGKLGVEPLGDEFTWFDTGTHDSILLASNKIKELELKNKMKIGCIEEIALKQKFISAEDLTRNINKYKDNGYYDYLKELVKNS
jgi:glucose-1-phosphate thymidylyltransferase